MKICKQCKIEKDESEFYKQQQRGKLNQVWMYYDCYCKPCRLEYGKQRSIRIKQQAIDYLGGKCTHCGLVDIPAVFDFHHLDPTTKEIALGQRGGLSFAAIKDELDKCIVLCSNCHRRVHNT